jgi:hypothetical protein
MASEVDQVEGSIRVALDGRLRSCGNFDGQLAAILSREIQREGWPERCGRY